MGHSIAPLVEVRRAALDDARSIAAIHVSSARAAYQGLLPDQHLQRFTLERREQGWREIIETGAAEIWIAGEGGKDLGWICVGTSRDGDADAATAELWSLYVDPDCWRRGVGRVLWAHAEARLMSARFSRVTLWTLQDNVRALDFYRSLGFVEDAGQVMSRERGGAQITDVRLRRQLGG